MCKETIASTCIEIKVETRDIPFDQVQCQGQEFTNCKEPQAQEWEDHILHTNMVVFTLLDQRVLKRKEGFEQQKKEITYINTKLKKYFTTQVIL